MKIYYPTPGGRWLKKIPRIMERTGSLAEARAAGCGNGKSNQDACECEEATGLLAVWPQKMIRSLDRLI
jgi:hypothetical protein